MGEGEAWHHWGMLSRDLPQASCLPEERPLGFLEEKPVRRCEHLHLWLSGAPCSCELTLDLEQCVHFLVESCLIPKCGAGTCPREAASPCSHLFSSRFQASCLCCGLILGSGVGG